MPLLEHDLGADVGGLAALGGGGIEDDVVDDDFARAAIEEGVVPGGSVALLKAVEAAATAKVKGDERFGREIVVKALEAPLRQLAENAGENGSVAIERVREKGKNHGFNALTRTYEDMFKAGIIDPAKVVRSALQNAASIAGLLLTTDSMVTDLKDAKKPVPGSLA